MAEPRPLTAKQERFCQLYVANGLNATGAARDAGYAKPNTQGPRLLVNVGIMARLAELTAPVLMQLDLSKEAVLREIGLIAFARMGRVLHITADGDPYLDFSKMTEAEEAALEGAEIDDFTGDREVNAEGETVARNVRRVKGKMGNKAKALELLMRYHGMLHDKVELTVGDDFASTLLAARKRARDRRTDG